MQLLIPRGQTPQQAQQQNAGALYDFAARLNNYGPSRALPGGGFGSKLSFPWMPMNQGVTGVTVPTQVPIPTNVRPTPVLRDSDQRRPWENYPFMGLSSLGRSIKPMTGLNYDWL